jgi:hypothetical protein
MHIKTLALSNYESNEAQQYFHHLINFHHLQGAGDLNPSIS